MQAITYCDHRDTHFILANIHWRLTDPAANIGSLPPLNLRDRVSMEDLTCISSLVSGKVLCEFRQAPYNQGNR